MQMCYSLKKKKKRLIYTELHGYFAAELFFLSNKEIYLAVISNSAS